ncbi:unnamed protein product [Brassicogethes aeneus]|uniref:Major facilitator superfamily (MFS) profile domain-containing protein n=1 Tax=Brassicogethes aeneus TaxID=1431903 RepID=A0A9P0B362_BRAAE|nr:unnamed protein product [Brassicogethes aeneus]
MAKIALGSGQKTVASFEDAIHMTGFGKFNLFVIITCGGCLMCVILETMCMSFIIPAAQCDLNLNLSEKGLLSSISFFGVVSSSHLWGFLADTRGRKMVLVQSLLCSSVLSFACCLVPWSWLFILLRFFNGFFIGGCSAVIYAYAGEFHDQNFRPKTIAWMTTFVAFGNMFLPSLAWAILPQQWSYNIPFMNITFKPWRLLLIIYALPSLVVAACLIVLPESPKYLLTQGRYKEALEILKTMYKFNFNKQADDYPVSDILWDELDNSDEVKKRSLLVSMWRQTVPLFKKPFLIKTLMFCSLQFLIFFSSAGIVMWYPEILNEMSQFSANSSERVSLCRAMAYDDDDYFEFPDQYRSLFVFKGRVCKDLVKPEVFQTSLLVGSAYACMFVLVGALIGFVGKKKLLVSFLTVCTACGLASQFVYGYTLIQMLIGVFTLCGAAIGLINAFVVDLYPTQIRGMALAVSLMFGRFGAMTGSNLIGPLLYHFCDYVFFVVAANSLVVVILVLLLPSMPHIPRLKETITH